MKWFLKNVMQKAEIILGNSELFIDVKYLSLDSAMAVSTLYYIKKF